ncbi:hypothetical protein bAD24_I16630 [Burkholderia sp. AD24]|nr:hypothetical protein bAD24_I16630 [Burkholderia sp. AD24]
MVKTCSLVLDAMIVTGNTKAAVKAAGGGSSDLWTVPPDQIYYDPRDNVRPLDQDRVRHVANLIKANGYDRKHPLGCFVRKVGGEDRIFVYSGQHRYHGALLAISEGSQIDRLPVVIDDAKSVNRVNLIYAGVSANDSEKLTPLQLAEKVVQLQALGEKNSTICERLNVTDQTIRDVLLLANAPAGLHKLVREKIVSSTLAIEEVRAHGGEKALERMLNAASKANASGKGKVTKKVLDATAPESTSKKITDPQTKQLFQALQSVLHDPVFGKLSPGTIAGVHAALTPHADLLDAVSTKHERHPIHAPNANGIFADCETIRAPIVKRTRLSPAEIHLAQPDDGAWICSTTLRVGNSYTSCLPSMSDFASTYPTRVQAIRAAVSELTRALAQAHATSTQEARTVRTWLDKLWAMPDPDWTGEMAQEIAK